MFSLLKKHPIATASIPLLFAWLLIFILPPQALHNDDFQLYFMFCNGGKSAIPFSFYSGVLLGWLLMGLNWLNSSLSWYLIILHIVSSCACFGLNFFAISRSLSHDTGSSLLNKSRLLGILSILLYINYQCILSPQYTHTGILCSCVSLFLLYDWLTGAGGRGRLAASLLLLLASFELRDQSIAPFIILGAGAALAVWFNRQCISKKRYTALLLFPVLIAALAATNNLTFRANPDWHEAKQYCLCRNGIHDTRDNSGIDKSKELIKGGINPTDFELFKTFTYVPGFCQENSEYLAIARYIHQDQRKGLFGSPLAARLGILSTEGYEFKGGSTFLRAITPWMPLLAGLIFLIPGLNRSSFFHATPMLLAVLAYFGILLLLQRAVDRALHPVLYTGGIWLMVSPIGANRFSRHFIVCIGTACAAMLITLFCLRTVRWLFKAPEQAWQYCAAHPENLYLTTSMQHLGIYPPGWRGVSLQYFANSNLIPIADGWCFYSPAYKASLKARGITNPYAVICKPNTYVVTQNNVDEEWPLQNVSAIHKQLFGNELLFKKCHSVSKFTFWQAQAKN